MTIKFDLKWQETGLCCLDRISTTGRCWLTEFRHPSTSTSNSSNFRQTSPKKLVQAQVSIGATCDTAHLKPDPKQWKEGGWYKVETGRSAAPVGSGHDTVTAKNPSLFSIYPICTARLLQRKRELWERVKTIKKQIQECRRTFGLISLNNKITILLKKTCSERTNERTQETCDNILSYRPIYSRCLCILSN